DRIDKPSGVADDEIAGSGDVFGPVGEIAYDAHAVFQPRRRQEAPQVLDPSAGGEKIFLERPVRGGAALVILDRYDDSDTRLHAHRNVPRPAPSAEVADEGHRRMLGDILEWPDDPARADIVGAREIAPYRNEPEIRVEPFGAELACDERCLPGRVDQETTMHALRAAPVRRGDNDVAAARVVRDKAFSPHS